jgi:hypothetical protein
MGAVSVNVSVRLGGECTVPTPSNSGSCYPHRGIDKERAPSLV